MNINISVDNNQPILMRDVKGVPLLILEFADKNFTKFLGLRYLTNMEECSVNLSTDGGSCILLHSIEGWNLNIPNEGIYQTFGKALAFTAKINDRGISEWRTEAYGAWVFLRIPRKPFWLFRLLSTLGRRRKKRYQLPAFSIQLMLGQHRKHVHASDDVALAERVYACLTSGV